MDVGLHVASQSSGGVTVDYNKKTSLHFPFTTPKNGLAFLTVTYENITNTFGGYYYVNGILLAYERSGGDYNMSQQTIVVPLSKGDVVTFSGSIESNQSYFVPFR